jgi:hypothetical protein
MLVFPRDRSQQIVASAQKEFPQLYPQAGWVEHDPLELYSSQYGVMMEAITRGGIVTVPAAAEEAEPASADDAPTSDTTSEEPQVEKDHHGHKKHDKHKADKDKKHKKDKKKDRKHKHGKKGDRA